MCVCVCVCMCHTHKHTRCVHTACKSSAPHSAHWSQRRIMPQSLDPEQQYSDTPISSHPTTAPSATSRSLWHSRRMRMSAHVGEVRSRSTSLLSQSHGLIQQRVDSRQRHQTVAAVPPHLISPPPPHLDTRSALHCLGSHTRRVACVQSHRSTDFRGRARRD